MLWFLQQDAMVSSTLELRSDVTGGWGLLVVVVDNNGSRATADHLSCLIEGLS